MMQNRGMTDLLQPIRTQSDDRSLCATPEIVRTKGWQIAPDIVKSGTVAKVSTILRVLGILLVLIAAVTRPTFAQEFTLEELLTVARTQSTPVSAKIQEIENMILDLKITQTAYNPKVTLSSKPLAVSPSLASDELTYDTTAGVNASWKLPFGLELSTSANYVKLLDNEARDSSYILTLKYAIYPGMKTDQTLAQIKVKERNLEKARHILVQKQQEAEIQVRKRFYSALILQEKLRITEANLVVAEADLRLYRDLKNRGDVSQRDVLDKEIAYKSSQISYEKSSQLYQNTVKDLLTYTGVDSTTLTTDWKSISLKGDLAELRKLTPTTPDQLPSREELIRRAEPYQLAIADVMGSLITAEEELARTKNWPELNTVFDYRPNTQSRDDEYNWSWMINASYALIDGGKVRLEREKQSNAVENLKEQVNELPLTIAQEIENRLNNIKVAYYDYQSAELELMKARLDQQLKDEQFAKGLVTASQRQSGERIVLLSEIDTLQKRLDYQVTLWELNLYVYQQLQSNEVK